METMQPALRCESLHCLREQWNGQMPSCVTDASATFRAGEFCGLCGPDGSGKGLFLNVLGLLERPDSGSLAVQGILAAPLDPEAARNLRNTTFGFVFNHPCLLPAFSVAENVAMPLFRICGGDAETAQRRTRDALEFCGVAPLESTLAGRLDPEDRVRTALARALVHEPRILIAISPGDSDALLELGRRAADELGLCVLWTGGAEALSRFSHRILRFEEGRIADDFHP